MEKLKIEPFRGDEAGAPINLSTLNQPGFAAYQRRLDDDLSYKNARELNTLIDHKLPSGRPSFRRYNIRIGGETVVMYGSGGGIWRERVRRRKADSVSCANLHLILSCVAALWMFVRRSISAAWMDDLRPVSLPLRQERA